ncbi:MAG: hypothetical protein ACOC2F_00070 [Bacteroidota bacterium]
MLNDTNGLANITFNKYNTIILSQTFERYTDPKGRLKAFLDSTYIPLESTKDFDGVTITLYENPDADTTQQIVIKSVQEIKIEEAKQRILENKKWMNQIKEKAAERQISVDSMLYLDAIWYVERAN